MPLATPIATGPSGEAASAVAAVAAGALTKRIDEKVILDGLDFEIPRGGYVALLGANGAGKSTLLKTIATLLPPTSGSLEILGEVVKRESVAVRSRLGLIAHGAMLYRELSPMENLLLFGRLYGVPEPRERARQLLRYVQLTDRADDPVKTFSRGMTQRVSIARALMHDPELLLADEPFAGLDAPSTRALEDLMGRLNEEGKTIVLANHDLDQSLRLAERALVLRRGRLVVDEAADALDRAGVLAEMEAP